MTCYVIDFALFCPEEVFDRNVDKKQWITVLLRSTDKVGRPFCFCKVFYYYFLSFFLSFFQSRYLLCFLSDFVQTLLVYSYQEVEEPYTFSGPYCKGQGHKEIKLENLQGSITLLFSVRLTSNFADT